MLDEPDLLLWLDHPPQTNEVGRSAVLMSGLLVIADLFPQPVELLELGASAGRSASQKASSSGSGRGG